MAHRHGEKFVKTLNVNGYEMAYLEKGRGKPLVLVHGSMADCRSWALQMAVFSQYFWTVSVSLRHCWPDIWDGKGEGFSLQGHARDLALFIQKLTPDPVMLLGHSRGGAVSLVTARALPRSISHLILADPAPLASLLPKTGAVLDALDQRNAFVKDSVEQIEKGDMDSGLAYFSGAVSLPGAWKALPEAARQMRRDNAFSLKSLGEDAQTPFTVRDVQQIRARVLLMTAEKSPALYGMMHSALGNSLSHYKTVTIPNASHGMFRDNPHDFNRTVLNFLKK